MKPADNQIINQLKQAIERILNAYEKYKKTNNDENKNFLFDIIISNLELINNLYRKLDDKTLKKINIDTDLFEFYANELLDTKKQVDKNLMTIILEKELPFLRYKLNKV